MTNDIQVQNNQKMSLSLESGEYTYDEKTKKWNLEKEQDQNSFNEALKNRQIEIILLKQSGMDLIAKKKYANFLVFLHSNKEYINDMTPYLQNLDLNREKLGEKDYQDWKMKLTGASEMDVLLEKIKKSKDQYSHEIKMDIVNYTRLLLLSMENTTKTQKVERATKYYECYNLPQFKWFILINPRFNKATQDKITEFLSIPKDNVNLPSLENFQTLLNKIKEEYKTIFQYDEHDTASLGLNYKDIDLSEYECIKGKGKNLTCLSGNNCKAYLKFLEYAQSKIEGKFPEMPSWKVHNLAVIQWQVYLMEKFSKITTSTEEFIKNFFKNEKDEHDFQLKKLNTEEEEIYQYCLKNKESLPYVVSMIPWKHFNAFLIQRLVENNILNPQKVYDKQFGFGNVHHETFEGFLKLFLEKNPNSRNANKVADILYYLDSRNDTDNDEEELTPPRSVRKIVKKVKVIKRSSSPHPDQPEPKKVNTDTLEMPTVDFLKFASQRIDKMRVNYPAYTPVQMMVELQKMWNGMSKMEKSYYTSTEFVPLIKDNWKQEIEDRLSEVEKTLYEYTNYKD